ncbi:hypothetical protein GCM10011608_17120 [Micromonospora sonchi]|uniref:Uncharacterized protein n=1 Tax=Micromonospora sonchi TaxID=1763543 RepID=A0A917TQF2_9ACTN|nr:hypothetical protein [Micromonospora sonchi]GGM33207.1 hypothetical protein GCM10011608_17120 [Micromonospora sonchi]
MVGRLARHLAGAVAAWLMFVGQAAVVYLGLIGYALVANEGLGGPLGGLILMLIAAAVGVVLVPLLFVPAGLIGDAVAKDGRFIPKMLITCAGAAVLAAIYMAVVAVATGEPVAATLWSCLGAAGAVLAPTAAHVAVAAGVLKVGQTWRRRNLSEQVPHHEAGRPPARSGQA